MKALTLDQKSTLVKGLVKPLVTILLFITAKYGKEIGEEVVSELDAALHQADAEPVDEDDVILASFAIGRTISKHTEKTKIDDVAIEEAERIYASVKGEGKGNIIFQAFAAFVHLGRTIRDEVKAAKGK